LPEQAIADARILHVSALSQAISPSMRAAVTRAAEVARANATLVSYDTNLRLNLWSLTEARDVITEFLPLADIVFPSDDEAELLTGIGDAVALADYFLGFGTSQVLLKRGARGVVLATPDGRESIPAQPTEAVDSTGAGDSFAGAYLAYFLETGDMKLAAERATIVAAGTVGGMGAIDPIPRRVDVLGG
jgi:2-dehydro-3-deoxygluconokinase